MFTICTILDNLDIFIYNFYQIVFRIFTVLTMLNQLTSLHIFIYFGVYSCIEETVINIVVFSSLALVVIADPEDTYYASFQLLVIVLRLF